METIELFNLTVWVQEKITGANVPACYQNVLNILSRNAQQNQAKQPFESQKEKLIETIEKITFHELTKEQVDCLCQLNIAQYIGIQGVNNVNDILYKNSLDIATAVSKFQSIINSLNSGIQVINNLHTGLQSVLPDEKSIENDKIIIRVSFKKDAEITNFKEFKQWGNIWYEICYGIALAHDLTIDDVNIIGASKGSIIVILATIGVIATTISGILLEGLKVTDKVLDLKKKAEEIRGMKLQNDKIAAELETEAENEKKQGAKTICDAVTIKLQIGNNGTGDKSAALSKSISHLIDFIEKGGDVDFVLPEEAEEKELNLAELKASFKEIRQLEEKLKLLEGPKNA